MAALKGFAGSSASLAALPVRVFASVTPVAAAGLVARAGGPFSLVWWWALSVSRGVLPALMAWLASR